MGIARYGIIMLFLLRRLGDKKLRFLTLIVGLTGV
jgi:hypothetical protein